MRAVIQCARGGKVTVGGEKIGGFSGVGLVVLLGITHDDSAAQVTRMVDKIANLRILGQEQSALELGAPILLVSQFTLYGSVKKGRRPSWVAAAPGEVAEPLFDAVVTGLRDLGLDVSTGQFGAMMEVSLTNDGPCTIWVEI